MRHNNGLLPYIVKMRDQHFSPAHACARMRQSP